MEQRVESRDKAHNKGHLQAPRSSSSSQSTKSQEEDYLDMPTLSVLLQSRQLQSQVDQRLQELQTLNHQGKCKFQRGGSTETVLCKQEIPWPQNFILSCSTKYRTSYDNLSMSQWVAGFGAIIREETNLATKTHMLEYLI